MTRGKTGRPRKKRRPKSRLGAWMRAHDKSAEEMAELLDVARSTVYSLLDRALRPGLGLALRIEDVTGIPAGYWK